MSPEPLLQTETFEVLFVGDPTKVSAASGVVDVPPGHEIVVLSVAHYDALVERVEELETSDYVAEVTRLRGAIDDLDEDLADARFDAEGWEKEARKAEARVAELVEAIRKVDLERLTFDDLLRLVDDV